MESANWLVRVIWSSCRIPTLEPATQVVPRTLVMAGEEEILTSEGTGASEAELAAAQEESLRVFRENPPKAIIVNAGDMVCMNCKAFHYGDANTSRTPRALLNVTFQEPGPSGTLESLHGFTYHIEEGIRGRYQLGDFLGPSTARFST
jgi:hypothetical protein